MVLGVILDLSIRGSIWIIQSAYNGVHYLYYGHTETYDEKILRELQELKKDNISLREELKKAIEKPKGDADDICETVNEDKDRDDAR